jgi:hypothetical protein
MGRLRRGQDWARSRRERLEALLSDGQVRLEQARARSSAVDAVVWMVRRERPVAAGILAAALYFAPRAARASTVYGSLGVALVLLVSLFLFGRLAVAAAELNATLWERRAQRRRPKAPPP